MEPEKMKFLKKWVRNWYLSGLIDEMYMAMSILFCTKNVLHRGKVLKKGFVRRGGTIFHGEDLSAVVLWRVYVGSLEM